MLQRQIMFKQLEELRRQQQLQKTSDVRHQNYMNQLSSSNRHTSGIQLPNLIDGIPVHDGMQLSMFGNTHLLGCETSPAVQGFQNGSVFSQAQSQAMCLMGMLPEQIDVSLHGNPNATRSNFDQYAQFQATPHDSNNMLAKHYSKHVEIPTMQPSAFSSAFAGDHCSASPHQICMPDGTFISKQLVQDKYLLGQVPVQSSTGGVSPRKLQQMGVQIDPSIQESVSRQEKVTWPSVSPGNILKTGHCQRTASLDPLEEKILFNTDDNGWNSSLGKHSTMGGFESTVETADYVGAFPSMQSGSWSALMQSAVAEASSSDTGLQEEWSGLSFQNPEISTDNQPSNYVESEQQCNWVDNNLQSTSSPSSKPEPVLHNFNMNLNYSGFQPSNYQFFEQRDRIHSRSSQESVQQSPRVGVNLGDHSQMRLLEGTQMAQVPSTLQQLWPDQYFRQPEDAHPAIGSSYTGYGQTRNSLMRTVSDSVSGLDESKCSMADRTINKESRQLNNFIVAQKKGTNRVKQNLQLATNQHVDTFAKNLTGSMQNDSHQLIDNYQNLVTPERKGGQTDEVNHIGRDNSTVGYWSNTSCHSLTGHELEGNLMQAGGGHPMLDKPQAPQVLHGSELEYVDQFKLINDIANIRMEAEKGQSLDVRGKRALEDTLPGNDDELKKSINHISAGCRVKSIFTQASEDVFSHSNKDDISVEHRTGANLSSTNSIELSEIPPAASVPQSYSDLSASDGFSLRFHPSSQQMSKQHSPPLIGKSGAVSPFGLPFVNNQPQNYHMTAVPFMAAQYQQVMSSGTTKSFRAFSPSSFRASSPLIHPNPLGQEFPILETMPITRQLATSGGSRQDGLPMQTSHMSLDVPNQHHHINPEPHKNPFNLIKSPDGASSHHREPQDQRAGKEENNTKQIGTSYGQSQDSDDKEHELGTRYLYQPKPFGMPNLVSPNILAYGPEALEKQVELADTLQVGSLSNNKHQQAISKTCQNDQMRPMIPAGDTEVFSCSLRPSHVHNRNSLLQQMHSPKHVETDTGSRMPLKYNVKYNGADSGLSSQQVSANAKQQLLYGNKPMIVNSSGGDLFSLPPSGSPKSAENKIARVSLEASGGHSGKVLSQAFIADTQQMHKYGLNETLYPTSCSAASNKTEQSHVGLQIAPSWFKHNGTLKNGQMSPMYMANAMAANSAIQQMYFGKSFENLQVNRPILQTSSASGVQGSSIWPGTSTSAVPTKALPVSSILPQDGTNQNLAILRPTKRKFSGFRFVSWHKEVTQDARKLQTIRSANFLAFHFFENYFDSSAFTLTAAKSSPVTSCSPQTDLISF